MGKVEKTLAENVLKKRNALGLSQDALAQKARISYHTVWRIENAKRLPRKGSLLAIATALGCTVDQLYEDPDGTRDTINNAVNTLTKALNSVKPKPTPYDRLPRDILDALLECDARKLEMVRALILKPPQTVSQKEKKKA